MMSGGQKQNLFYRIIHLDGLQFFVPFLIQFLVIQNDLVYEAELIIGFLCSLDVAQAQMHERMVSMVGARCVSHLYVIAN